MSYVVGGTGEAEDVTRLRCETTGGMGTSSIKSRAGEAPLSCVDRGNAIVRGDKRNVYHDRETRWGGVHDWADIQMRCERYGGAREACLLLHTNHSARRFVLGAAIRPSPGRTPRRARPLGNTIASQIALLTIIRCQITPLCARGGARRLADVDRAIAGVASGDQWSEGVATIGR